MKKKSFTTLICLALMIGGTFFFFYAWNVSPLQKPCPFCNPTIIANQKFYEDDLVVALYTHKPIFPGHCLVIPKRHVERFDMLTDEEMIHIHQVIRKVHQAASKAFGTTAYLLIQKNGYEVGQTVPHLHFHYIPRQAGNSSIATFFGKMLIANIQAPLSSQAMQEVVQKMKEAME